MQKKEGPGEKQLFIPLPTAETGGGEGRDVGSAYSVDRSAKVT